MPTIYDFPPEVTVEIILCVYHDNCAAPGATLGWIKLSHVCRYWRNCMLECPKFWENSLILLNEDAVHTFRKRARGFPLTLDLGMSVEVLGTRDTIPVLDPALVACVLREDVFARASCLRLGPDINPSPPEFFCRTSERVLFRDLTSLELDLRGNIHVPVFEAPALLSLKLESQHSRTNPPGGHASIDTVLRIWKSSPKLQTLELNYVFARQSNFIESFAETRSLSSLKLHIEDESFLRAVESSLFVTHDDDFYISVSAPVSIAEVWRCVCSIGSWEQAFVSILPSYQSYYMNFDGLWAGHGKGDGAGQHLVLRMPLQNPTWNWLSLGTALPAGFVGTLFACGYMTPDELPDVLPAHLRPTDLFRSLQGIEILFLKDTDILAGALSDFPDLLPAELRVGGGPEGECLLAIRQWISMQTQGHQRNNKMRVKLTGFVYSLENSSEALSRLREICDVSDKRRSTFPQPVVQVDIVHEMVHADSDSDSG